MKKLFLTLGLLMFLGTPVMAQGLIAQEEHSHDGVVGKFYRDWNMPNNGNRRNASCCNKQDCYATPIVKFDDGKYYARRREDGKWLLVPNEKLEQLQQDPVESPDHQSHACIASPATGSDYVYCATIGTGI